MYGREVQLTFHGDDKFRTKFGAFCTLVIAVLLASYAFYSLVDLLSPQPTMPFSSKLYYSNFYENFEGMDQVMARNGEVAHIASVDDSVTPMKFFAFGLADQSD